MNCIVVISLENTYSKTPGNFRMTLYRSVLKLKWKSRYKYLLHNKCIFDVPDREIEFMSEILRWMNI